MKFRIYVAPAVIVFLIGIFPIEWWNLYARYPYLDKVMHVAGGMAIAWLASALLRKDAQRLSPLFFVLLLMGATALVGVLWEIAEYGAAAMRYTLPLVYRYFHGGDHADTIGDLASDVIGGALLAIPLALSFRHRPKSGQGH